jgi:hypothetical protein
MSPLQRAPHAPRKARARACVLMRGVLIIGALPCWLALAGCSSALVRPDAKTYTKTDTKTDTAAPAHPVAEVPKRKLRALLAQQPPSCEYKGPDADGLDADLWERVKLDYELHCYQRAEALLRSRLRALVSSAEGPR